MILIAGALALYGLLLLAAYLGQRSFIYFPSHHEPCGALTPWVVRGQTIGYCREVTEPKTVWLVAHGNAGQAADRDYLLHCFSSDASVYIVEYPGYGERSGRPTAESLNKAVEDAYTFLIKQHPRTGVSVAGESIGGGPACRLARHAIPPRKVVLFVPFDTFVSVAAEHMRYIPVRWLLKDRWDNVEALKTYRGEIEIYAAVDDSVIPAHHARRLAEAVQARLTLLPGDHNDWSNNEIAVR